VLMRGMPTGVRGEGPAEPALRVKGGEWA
jgi:hypothetical protein